LAINAIPAYLAKGHAGYLGPDGKLHFFFPFFYFHEALGKYLVGSFVFLNYTGDVVALGFFPAMGLFSDSLHRWKEKKGFVGILASFLGAITLAVVLFLSRGTMISFSIAVVLYLLAMLIKFPSRHQLIFVAAVFLLILGFLVGSGQLEKTWKEVQTVKEEMEVTTKSAPSSAIREGAQRALAIYRTFPLLGVGTAGYSSLSPYFATPGREVWPLIQFEASCHYLQVLAEEGVGAYFYFLFLLAYFIEAGRGLIVTRGRFQFIAGLSLVIPVLMVFIHASTGILMQRFSISMPVYILMGASLAVLRPDFEHP
jgi:hypothetical protein